MRVKTISFVYEGEMVRVKYDSEAASPDKDQVRAILGLMAQNQNLESLPVVHEWLSDSLEEFSIGQPTAAPVTLETIRAFPDRLVFEIAKQIIDEVCAYSGQTGHLSR